MENKVRLDGEAILKKQSDINQLNGQLATMATSV
jgi:hypothetical protein